MIQWDEAYPELGSPEWWRQMATSPETLAAQVCYINTVDLDRTMQRHAALHAWVGAAFERARVEEERAKWEVTKAHAKALLDNAGTKNWAGKTKTVDEVKASAELDEEVGRTQLLAFAAAEKRAALRAMEKALDSRTNMLIQIAAKARREYDNAHRT
jgi:hypothetical protein